MKNLLLVSILLFISVAIWAVSKVGKRNDLSISLHVAKTRLTRVVFGIVVFIATLLACYTIFGWILPHYGASWTQYVLYAVIVMDLFTIALVPHVEGTWREVVHNLAAWGMVYVVPVAMVAAQFWPLAMLARISSLLLTLVVLILLMLALFRREKYRHIFLYFQSTYLLGFFTFLLVVTYF